MFRNNKKGPKMGSGTTMGVYTLYDRVACRYGPLFESVNDSIAIREYNLILSKVPDTVRGDYSLQKVAEFCTESGHMKVVSKGSRVIDVSINMEVNNSG